MSLAESSRELAWIRGRLAEPLPVDADTAVIATNLQGLVAYWNGAAERLYGWPEEEALGRDILELTPAKYSRGQSAEIMAALRAGQTWRGEILLQRRDNAPLLAFVLDIPVGDLVNGQGAIVGVSALVDRAWRIEDLAARIGTALRRRFAAEGAA